MNDKIVVVIVVGRNKIRDIPSKCAVEGQVASELKSRGKGGGWDKLESEGGTKI